MKKFMMTCAAIALMTGPALAEEQVPQEAEILQEIVVEEAAPAATPKEVRDSAPRRKYAKPTEVPSEGAATEAAAQEEEMKQKMAAPQEIAPAPAPTTAEAAPEQPAEAAPVETATEQAAPPAAEQPEAPAQTAQEEQPAEQPAAEPVQETAQEQQPAPTAGEQPAVTIAEEPAPEKAESKQAASSGPHEETPEVRKLNEEQLEKFMQEKAAGQTDEQLIKTTETVIMTGPQEVPDMDRVDFMTFDSNGDGALSRDEVGESLYRMFDRDGNQVIDNREMTTVNVMTFIPMEREMVEVVDYQDGSKPERVTISHEEFMKTSKLIAFDKDKDGLSPLDFLGKRFNQVDVTNDKVIDLMEWKRAYEALTKQPHEEGFRYNG